MYEDLVKRLHRMLDWELMDYDANFKFADETIAEAANAIEKLSRAQEQWIEQERKMLLKSIPRWIPVTERLPETYGTRLVTTARGSVMVCCYYPQAKNWNTRATVTHWQPLPEPPKENGKSET